MALEASQQPSAVLAALTSKHRVLADEAAQTSVAPEALKGFIEEARNAGAMLDDPGDRASASRIMRYWASEAIRLGAIKPDETPPSLAPYQAPSLMAPEALGITPKLDLQSVVEPSPEEMERITMARRSVRIAALARQWRQSGKLKGYLLSGDALSEAKLFVNDNGDIAELVTASERAATWGRRVTIALLATAVVILSCALFITLQSWEDARSAAKDARDAAKAADEEAKKAKADLQDLSENLRAERRRSTDLQTQLGTALQDLENSRGRSQSAEPPRTVAPALMNGYQENFLIDQQRLSGKEPGSAESDPAFIRFPQIAPAALANAFDAGRRFDSINFSIVMTAQRRMPLFTASNLDRRQVVTLVRRSIQFRPDPRLPAELQPDADWFHGKDFDLGTLVTAREIAWGPAFGSDPAENGLIAYSAVNSSLNITPQFDTFNRGLWADLERYAATQFSPGANRVTIFSGPVLADDDQVVDGLRVPRSYWKVMVSAAPDRRADLVVEAYLLPQFDPRTQQKIAQNTGFIPDTYRVSVRDIEALTGLDFGDDVRGADLPSRSNVATLQGHDQTAGQRLAARVPMIDAPDQDTRRTTTQAIITGLRDGGVTATPDQRVVIEALLTLGRGTAFAALSSAGRVNLATILAAIPRSVWDQPDFRDLKAGARRAIGDIELAVSSGKLPAMDQVSAQLQKAKPQLDWSLADGRTIYLQFAGMARDDVNKLLDQLRALGWSLPGAERVASAANLNEVRFAPSDEAAARLLIDDLKALGRNAIRPRPTTAVKQGVPEIWISD